MIASEIAEYGNWRSPIQAEHIVKTSSLINFLQVDNDTVYFTQLKPKEKGRTALIKYPKPLEGKEALPQSFNVRSSVHEYGGRSYLAHNDYIYFVNYSDQDIYILSDNGCKRITQLENFRFIDFCIDPSNTYLYAVAEEHHKGAPINTLVRINLRTHEIQTIANGYDFYSSPRVSPDGKQLAYTCWNQPSMPWNSTELFIANISDDHEISNRERIAGGIKEAISEVKFANDGTLYFTSNKNGFWNIYSYTNEETKAIFPSESDFGYPQWIFGLNRFCFIPSSREHTIAAISTEKGADSILLINEKEHTSSKLDVPFTKINEVCYSNESLYFTAGSSAKLVRAIKYNLETKEYTEIEPPTSSLIDTNYISTPELISFPSDQGHEAYGFFYPPKNPKFKAPKDSKIPLIIKCHGGPTAHASPSLSPEILYFTSRGVAFFDINCSGSSGHGKDYQDRLTHNWGVVDVSDCCNAVLHLVKNYNIDPERVAIRGGSSGGFTVLAALIHSSLFKAGVSYYGVSDLEMLVKDTHKFEASYLDDLIGPYPETKQRYIERSPVNNAKEISAPVLFLQGTLDKVVPPSQSEKMFEVLKERNIPTACILFEGEGHGFRAEKNIQDAIEYEWNFYSKIFKFQNQETKINMKIENLQ